MDKLTSLQTNAFNAFKFFLLSFDKQSSVKKRTQENKQLIVFLPVSNLQSSLYYFLIVLVVKCTLYHKTDDTYSQ